ncbi:MAG: FliM/FliN family flagellar motor switch protein [Spirochaetes bacterium]|nr:FliM/FliN family flagellar motor switch protein [Spirochaetota bacterium]
MNIEEEKGTLTVVLGRGAISRYELGVLKAGDVVRMANNAGRPFAVEFNGRHVARGEAVVLGFKTAKPVFGVRLSQVPGEPLTADPFPPLNDLVEILPAEIVLDRVPFSMAELTDVGVGTVIALERLVDGDIDLVVAGMTVARGRLMVHGENFAFRVTEKTIAVKEQVAPRISGALIEPAREPRIKEYDFRRPDKFSRVAVNRFTQIHELFVEHLKAMMPETGNYRVTSTDQAAFYEVEDHLKSGDYRFFIVSTEQRPTGINYIPSVYGNGGRELKIFVQPAQTKHTHFREKEYQDMLAWWRDEMKKWYGFHLFLVAYHKDSVFGKLASDRSVEELFLTPLANGWKALVNTHLHLSKMSDKPEDALIIPKNDMILYSTIGEENNPSSTCFIIYPYITIEPVIPLME